MRPAKGPLVGVKVVELAGLGPAPFAGMVLSDLGAEVTCIDRPGDTQPTSDPLRRNRRSIAVDLKQEGAVDLVLELVAASDVLIEGFRPGVAERLGLGPDTCLAGNPRLVYGRMTGYGQDGPLARAPGHDMNYTGLVGALHHAGREGELPVSPVNFVGDFGGGGMLLALGVVSALLERASSGEGQVVDAAMVDGVALLTASLFGLRAEGRWNDERGTNLIDTGAPFYDVYAAADGRELTVGALERRFYFELMRITGIDADRWPNRFDRAVWADMRAQLAAAFATKTSAEWLDLFAGADTCVGPVLTLTEAVEHPHNVARGTYVSVDGVVQPNAAPRFSRTPGAVRGAGRAVGEDTDAVLAEPGCDPEARQALRAAGVVA